MSTQITLRQAEALLAFFGGQDAEVTIAAESPGLSPGLYAWLTEHPDEGAQYLGPTEVDDDLADQERPPTPAVQPNSVTQAWVLLQALVEAVRVFRNEAALARLGGLRGTRGYIGLCQAWDDARDWLEAAPAPAHPIGEVVVSTSLTGEDGLQMIKWAADAPPITLGMKLYASANEAQPNEWKEAVLDALAAWPGMDFAQDTPPRKIVEAALEMEWHAARDLTAPGQPVRNVLTAAARDVLAERQRQVGLEGFTPEHDDEHDAGELASAACAYALTAADKLSPYSQGDGNYEAIHPSAWPWASEWWKPGTARRMLEKAGALIIGEMDRIDRAAGNSATKGE
ncbi:hypothetical protein FHT32_001234 [Variovorax sp. SG517]|uniref:hypothetical protein n=1 Tax=Variovorax sp. SG517 TaxID=2587117 RepID=UPI00159E7660|nr:hypothetical protein [Variovorax sp. SG517]NVM87595.1 hypothetical protein [Variovorax sp. SG517]